MMNCPKCPSETLVETPALGNIPLDVCPGCSGIWFDKGELEALIKQSQSETTVDFSLINPKPKSLKCPRCEKEMMRGGLVNPLLLVDKCESCGGVWLDAQELRLVKKMLGLPEGDTEIKVARPAPSITPRQPVESPLLKIFSGLCAMLGLIGISYEMYLYFSPAAAVAHVPSMSLMVFSILLFAGGVFGLLRKK